MPTDKEISVLAYPNPDKEGQYTSLNVAQMSDNPGNTTGVGEIDGDDEEIAVIDGNLIVPEGARIFTLNGMQLAGGQNVPAGVYVVVLRSGKAVKVLVK